jgi:hypothetical protein
MSGKNKKCTIDLDLSSYEGTPVSYYFEVKDPVHTVVSSAKTITIDNTKPKVNIVSPGDKGTYTERRLPFTVNVEEDGNVKSLDYSLDGRAFGRLCRNCDYYDARKTFLRGDHTLVVRATDYAGNVGVDTAKFKIV